MDCGVCTIENSFFDCFGITDEDGVLIHPSMDLFDHQGKKYIVSGFKVCANENLEDSDVFILLLAGDQSKEIPAFNRVLSGYSSTNKKLRSIPTKDLIDELVKREGVEATTLAPNAKSFISAEGPAIVLNIID